MVAIRKIGRREFLQRTGMVTGGLVLGVALLDTVDGNDAVATDTFQPNVFVAIDIDGRITVWVSRTDMGQGTRTGMPMILAEELEVGLDDVTIVQADGDEKYGHQLTGGSLSVRLMWDPLRQAGATARTMLIRAAARLGDVEPGSCRARDGRVLHWNSDREWAYGDLVEIASTLDVPDEDEVELKDPATYRLIGESLDRIDGPDIVTGRARYGMDIRRSGMRYAAVARCPIYGGRRPQEFDPSPAMRIDGVERVFGIDGLHEGFYVADGIAVIARDTWSALRGAEALEIAWQEGDDADASTEQLHETFRRLVDERGEVVREDGDVDDALGDAAKTLEATYELPFLAHAPMEPMNCTIDLRGDRCEIWTPTQNPQTVRERVARLLGFDTSQVTVHVTLVGGGFGRRLYPDMELEAARIASEVDGPVQVVWSREEDMRHDRYRPASLHRLRGGVDADGVPTALHWHILNTHRGVFRSDEFPSHQFPNLRVEYTHVPWVLPRGAWRSTVHSQNPFVAQCFLDELGHAGGMDPMELRLRMLRERPRPRGDGDPPFDPDRMLRVVEEVADRSNWGRSVDDGHGRGIGFSYCYDSYVAEVLDLHVEDGRPRIDAVTAVVDCGRVVNPDLVRSQFEGGVVFALSATMMQEITVEKGRVQQGNFGDFPMMRLSETPTVTTHILENENRPGGIGEVPIPPTMPALGNAHFMATGERLRRVPLYA